MGRFSAWKRGYHHMYQYDSQRRFALAYALTCAQSFRGLDYGAHQRRKEELTRKLEKDSI